MKFNVRSARVSGARALAILATFSLAVIAFAPAQAVAQRSAPELEALVAPIALYPDPLLAQLLPAATYPDQIAEAAAYVAKNGSQGVESQGWDPSVAAIARYSEALQLLANDPAWANELGTAFLDETTGVMDAIQQMRSRAQASGALQSSPQQEVVMQDEMVRIIPAQENVIYVPQYDPQVVYVQSAPQTVEIEVEDDDVDWDDALVTGAIAFGAGVAMGAWCDMDCDWWGHSMYYHGYGGGGNYWHSGNYASFNRNTNINVNRPVWNNPSRPGGSGSRPGNRPANRPGAGNRPGDRPGAGNRPGADNRPGDRPGAGNRPGADNRPGAGNRPGADNRPGAGNRPGDVGRPSTRPADRPGGAGDRARPGGQPASRMDQDLEKKRRNAQEQMRGRMPSSGDRGMAGAGNRAGAGGAGTSRESRPDRKADDGGRGRGRNDGGSAADRSRSGGGSRGAFDSYQRGSDARQSSDRGARSRESSSFDGRGGGGGRSSFGGSGGGGRSSMGGSRGGGRSSSPRGGGGGGGRRGGGRRG